MSSKRVDDIAFSWPNWEESSKEFVKLVLELSVSPVSIPSSSSSSFLSPNSQPGP